MLSGTRSPSATVKAGRVRHRRSRFPNRGENGVEFARAAKRGIHGIARRIDAGLEPGRLFEPLHGFRPLLGVCPGPGNLVRDCGFVSSAGEPGFQARDLRVKQWLIRCWQDL